MTLKEMYGKGYNADKCQLIYLTIAKSRVVNGKGLILK